MRSLALPLLLLACTADEARLVRDPGPPPHEAPARHTLWKGDRPVGRVLGATADGRATIDLDRALKRDGRLLATDVLPPLVEGAGVLAFVRSERPPETDVWVLRDGRPRRVTSDGRSDRPVVLADGALLWISSTGGRAAWWRDGRPLSGPDVPVPAHPERTRVEGDRVHFHDGAGWWSLDPRTGEASRASGR